MAVEWIHRHNSFIQMNMSKHFSPLSSERITATTRKIVHINLTNPVVHKALKNASQTSIWSDSGT